MKDPKYIVVEGPIGVGKTTLAEMLAKDFNGKLIREPSEENPFLKRFYDSPAKYAFSTQLFFLLNRYQQQKELVQLDLFEQAYVSDYHFDKDRIFAYLNLNESELVLYEKIFAMLVQEIKPPDLVVYLQANPSVLMRRVKTRGYGWERKINKQYLEKVAAVYNQYFFKYDASPLLVVNTSEIDFVNRPQDYQAILKEILELKGGVRHLIPQP